MFKVNRFLAIIALFLFVVCMGNCGGGGGGGGSNPPSDTTVSGTVSPPAGVSPSSLTIVSLGETSPVGTTGSFSTKVYKEGVAVVAAMPEGKEFGLMNVVATSTTSTSSAKVTKGETKIVSAYKAASSSSIELNAKTTAVSMVFITPYFLTNDPVKAANIISIIENEPKVASLASVIESVFYESDPLSNLTLQQALIDAVQSVLDTMSAQASMATKAAAPSPPKILQLPKSSLAKSLKALFVTNPPYYADQDYITVKAIETTSGYDVSVESKNGGSVDWIAGAMQLDSSQFSSLLDLQVKASNNRSLYENEQSHILGELDATAKSYFRYFDLISTAFDWAFSKVFGNALEDRVTVPSTQDGIYLIRAHSGGWGKLVDSGEKSFVRTQVPNGSTMDTKSLSINGFMVIFDTMSAFISFDRLFPDEMNEVAKAGLEEAFSKVPYVIGNPDPNMRDLISVSADITKATLSKLTEILMDQLSKNFLKTIYRTTEIVGKSVVNLATLNTVIELGKPADRLLQLLVSATPLETAIIVVGEPFPTPVDTEKPSTPTNLKAIAVSSAQIDLSWDASTDNVGVAGYKIYRNGSHLKSVTTTSTSDTGLDTSTQYCYTVSAFDAAWNESGQSSQACATTLSSGYSISGTVTSGGAGLSGVTITLTGTGSTSTTTDSNGNYIFTGAQNGSYTITPSKTGYTFIPSNRTFTVSNANVTGQDFVATQAQTGSIQLPQTGQTKCYDTTGTEIPCAGTGQDGDIQAGVAWPNPRFTTNVDTTVTDNLTGLVWAPNGNIIPIRDPGWDADGTANDGAVTWQHALDYVAKLNAENYLGHADWRLPNINELESLFNGGEADIVKWLSTQGFNNVQSYWYWSSTTAVASIPYGAVGAWNVFMWDVGYTNDSNKDLTSLYVWPVRVGQSGSPDLLYPANIWKTGQKISYATGDDGDLQRGVLWPSPRFKDNGNGTVMDNLTGLIWTKDAGTPTVDSCTGGFKTWQGALDYVACLNANNYLGSNDWRLPNLKELYSLIDFSQINPALPLGHPFIDVQSNNYYWSSSTDAKSADSAWVVYMFDGYIYPDGKIYFSGHYIWPVRGGLK